MNIKDRIGHIVEIDWLNDLHDLQPENVKLPFNYGALKESILKYGFSLPFAVWNNEGEYYCIDGHTRKTILTELRAEGHNVPDKLKGFEVSAKDKKEAIEILVSVYNQKHNPFDIEVLTEWLQVEELDINLESVNVMVEPLEEDEQHEKNVKEITNMIAVSLTDEESEIWLHIKEKLGKNKDKNAIFELVKFYQTQNQLS